MTTWNQFVKEIAEKHNLSRKEAMKKASPLWKKKKRGKTTVKDVPVISEFPPANGSKVALPLAALSLDLTRQVTLPSASTALGTSQLDGIVTFN